MRPRSNRTLVIDLDGLPPLGNRLLSMALRARIRSKVEWREAVVWKVLERLKPRPDGLPHFLRAEVECLRVSAAKPDYDNLVISFKPLLDGLVEAGLVADDDPDQLLAGYRWQQGRHGQGRVRLTIRDLDPPV